MTPHYIEIDSDGERIGKCLVFSDRNGLASWYQGPVVRRERFPEYGNILAGLVDFLRGMRLVCISSASTQTVYEKNYYQTHFPALSGHFEAPFVDLEQGIQEIKGGFDRSLKKNLRKCSEAGVETEITGDAAVLEPYGRMLAYHRGRMNLGLPELFPNGASQRIFTRPETGMELALAKVDGSLLAGLGYITFGRVVIEVAAAQSEEYHERKLPAYELLKVKAIEHYKSRGMRLYDLQGVRRAPPTEKEANIRRFKLKFTGTLGEFGAMENEVLHPMGWARFRLQKKIGRIGKRVLGRLSESKHG
jgi:hypothetical protein